jgi:hypothetical protein
MVRFRPRLRQQNDGPSRGKQGDPKLAAYRRLVQHVLMNSSPPISDREIASFRNCSGICSWKRARAPARPMRCPGGWPRALRPATILWNTYAAVTFTRKAAAELRGRFQLALEKELEQSVEDQDAADRARTDSTALV